MADIRRTPPLRVGSAELIGKAMASLRAWKRDRNAVLQCPSCDADGLEIIDRSARPVAEWYQFNCKACGLDDALCLPMTTHRPMM